MSHCRVQQLKCLSSYFRVMLSLALVGLPHTNNCHPHHANALICVIELWHIPYRRFKSISISGLALMKALDKSQRVGLVLMESGEAEVDVCVWGGGLIRGI